MSLFVNSPKQLRVRLRGVPESDQSDSGKNLYLPITTRWYNVVQVGFCRRVRSFIPRTWHRTLIRWQSIHRFRWITPPFPIGRLPPTPKSSISQISVGDRKVSVLARGKLENREPFGGCHALRDALLVLPVGGGMLWCYEDICKHIHTHTCTTTSVDRILLLGSNPLRIPAFAKQMGR